MSCKPTGSPDWSKPHGTTAAGRPASEAGTVKMSPRYIFTGSSILAPISNAVVECGRKVARDQAADFLRLQVIGVVVAVREHVSADQDALLHFRAEALGARARVHVDEIRVLLRAVAVAHAVEAR